MRTPKPVKAGNVWFGTLCPISPINTSRITVDFANCVKPDSKRTERDGHYVLQQKECWLHRAEPCELSEWKPEFSIICESPPIRTDFHADKQQAVYEMAYKLMDYSREQAEKVEGE